MYSALEISSGQIGSRSGLLLARVNGDGDVHDFSSSLRKCGDDTIAVMVFPTAIAGTTFLEDSGVKIINQNTGDDDDIASKKISVVRSMVLDYGIGLFHRGVKLLIVSPVKHVGYSLSVAEPAYCYHGSPFVDSLPREFEWFRLAMSEYAKGVK